MRARHLFPAVVALAAACGGEKTATTDTTASLNPLPSPTGAAAESASAVGGGTGGVTSEAGAGSLGDPNTVAQLDSVNTAAKAGLTNLPVAVAVPLIRSFEGKLKGSNDAALRDIGDELDDVREALEKNPVDRGELAEALGELGPKVTKAAAKGGAAQATLRSIGAELTKAATALRAGGR
jgi:hypothetical protein